MLSGAEQINPYDRQLLLVYRQAVENSPYLNETQKRLIDKKLQEIVNIWTNKEVES